MREPTTHNRAARQGKAAALPTSILPSTAASPARHDQNAQPPKVWLAFLDSILPDDPDAQRALREWAGYCLTSRHLQKMLVLVGPPRSGKSTYANVLAELLGDQAVVGTSAAAMTERFGSAALIGKRLAIISDTRMASPRGRAKLVDWLVRITGNERVAIDRKGAGAWLGTLDTRLMIVANASPSLADPDGVLPSRTLTVRLQRSFVGTEDFDLQHKLKAELPGILRWAIEGAGQLYRRGHFEQPASGTKAEASAAAA